MIWRLRSRRADTREPEVNRADVTEPDTKPDRAAAAWPFTEDSATAREPLAQGRAVRILLADATGLDWSAIAPLLPVARDVAAEQGLVLVLLVDLVDFAGLRASGVVYDTVPNIAANAPLAPGLDWTAYAAFRRRLVHDKWQPVAIVRLNPTE